MPGDLKSLLQDFDMAHFLLLIVQQKSGHPLKDVRLLDYNKLKQPFLRPPQSDRDNLVLLSEICRSGVIVVGRYHAGH